MGNAGLLVYNITQGSVPIKCTLYKQEKKCVGVSNRINIAYNMTDQRNVTGLQGKQPDNTAHAFVRRDVLHYFLYENVTV
jgi:hypothetical protein